MIRNAILHILNEQPMRADLFEAPSQGDVGLRCTNLRAMSGKPPVFVDNADSIFFFPYLHIRFVEIPPGAISGSDPESALEIQRSDTADIDRRSAAAVDTEPDLEIDEDFLRRIREA